MSSIVSRRDRRLISRAKGVLRRYPRIRALLHPIWRFFQRSIYRFRNAIFLGRPIWVAAGKVRFRLYPRGQIAEYLFCSDFEAVERDFVASTIRRGMVMVDAGANVGVYTIPCERLVGDTGMVYAFEPAPETLQLLRLNLALNRCQRVSVSRYALSDKSDCLVLRVDETHPSFDGHRHVESIADAKGIRKGDELVPATTLDKFVATQGIRQIDFLKIDVEGAELSVLRGAVKSLAGYPRMTLLVECTKHREEVAALLKSFGYRSFEWHASERCLVETSFDEIIARGGNVIARRSGIS